jgi:tetratricopeptide (TPR) repeat protein
LNAAGERRVGGRAEGTEGRAPKKSPAARERRVGGRAEGTKGRAPKTRRLRLFAVAFAAALTAASSSPAAEPASPPDAEEAADFARRAALAALHGPPKIFLESLDADGIMQRLIGAEVVAGLSERQQELLRSAVREHFLQALAAPPGETGEIAWASTSDAGHGAVSVFLGLRYRTTLLKTRWTVARTRRGLAIEDVVLVDPGLSLAAEMGRALGPQAVRRRNAAGEARARALPRLAGVAAIVVVVLVFARRLPRDRRQLLWIAAVALLFLVDGALAVQRALSEPYALSEGLPPQPWRQNEKLALAAQAQGLPETAREQWTKALAEGAPAGPVYYQMGLSARTSGDPAEATADFERALAAAPPAPGAARELASIALAAGRNADARALLHRYLDDAGPDVESLAGLAVAETNLGDTTAALAAIASARALVGEDWRKAELEARIQARAGNAAAAVAALRPLEAQGKLDRSVLRAEPAYLPIATDPAWVAFLNESASPASAGGKP